MTLFRNNSTKSVDSAGKRVRFNSEPQVLGESAILPEDYFYSCKEIGNLKRQAKFAARRHSKGQASPDDLDSRGLEGYLIQGGYDAFRKCTIEYIENVVDMYYILVKQEGGSKEDKLRLFAASQSKAARVDAIRKAQQDATDAVDIYQTDGIMAYRAAINDVSDAAVNTDLENKNIGVGVKKSFIKSFMKPFKVRSSTARGA